MAGACDGQKRAPGPLELSLAIAVSHHMGAGNKSGSAARVARVLKTPEPSITLAPNLDF